MRIQTNFIKRFSGDFMGGTSAMLLIIPSTIAYGIMVYAPLGPKYASMAALGSILGTILFSLITPFIGSTSRLVSGPSASGAAVLSLFTLHLLNKGNVPPHLIPAYITILTALSGLMQNIIGQFGGGKFVKYIPFTVIGGYLSSVSISIIIGQVPKFLGLPNGMKWNTGMLLINNWHWNSIVVGIVTIIVMILSEKFIKKIPSVIVALIGGIITYFILSIFDHSLLSLNDNPFVIGRFSASPSNIVDTLVQRWSLFPAMNIQLIGTLIVPSVTLAVLLSVTTLNACVVLDTLTLSSHNPKNELKAQGLGTIASALICGIPGTGSMAATLENLRSGGKTRYSAFISGCSLLLLLLLAAKFLAWLPLAALAGILILVAIRMINLRMFQMLKNKHTIFDFFVIISVVISSVYFDLITAAGVGIVMAIFLFLKEQMGMSVIRRKLFGNQMRSKKTRLKYQREALEKKGGQTLVLELQGQLFFGTTDQLYSRLESYFTTCKYFIFDLRRIQSVDYTAANMLKKILARIKKQNGYLIFTSIPDALPNGQNVTHYLATLDLVEKDNLKIFGNLGDALEWVEEEILLAEDLNDDGEGKILDLDEIEFFKGLSSEVINNFKSCIVEKVFEPNEFVFSAGDPGNEICFIRNGSVKIVLSMNEGKASHLFTIGMGVALEKAHSLMEMSAPPALLQTSICTCICYPKISWKKLPPYTLKRQEYFINGWPYWR